MARRRDPRTFITVHDGMPDHPKIEGLSDAAFRLLVSTWCWCSRQLTDGQVLLTSWNKRGTPKARKELLEAGLAVLDGDIVRMHDYLEHQRSADEVAAMREQRKEAGKAGGVAKAKRTASETSSKPLAKAKRPAKQNASETLAETDLLLTKQENLPPTAGADAPPSEALATNPNGTQALIGEWIDHCAKRPPQQSIGRVGKVVAQMLAEAIDPDDIRRGLARWKDRGLDPSVLPGVVNEVMNAAPDRGRGHTRPTDVHDLSTQDYSNVRI